MAFLKSQGLRKSQDCSFNSFTPFKDVKRVTFPLCFIIYPVPDTGKVLCTACGSLRPQPPPSVTEWENPRCTSCWVCSWFCPRRKGKHHTLSTLVPRSEKMGTRAISYTEESVWGSTCKEVQVWAEPEGWRSQSLPCPCLSVDPWPKPEFPLSPQVLIGWGKGK